MRTRLPLLGALAVVGCTMTNPAFDGSGTEGTAGDGDGDLTTTASSSTGQETLDPVCELGPGQELEINLGPAGCDDDMPDHYDRLHVLASISGSTMSLYSCPENATDCTLCGTDRGDIPTPMSFAPLQLDGIAPVGACLRVSARRLNPTNADVCRFQTVMIEVETNTNRQPILLGRNTPGIVLPPVDQSSLLSGFDPVLVVDETCPCAPGECCGGTPPTTYAWDVGGGQIVDLGAKVNLLLGSNGSYKFSALDGFQSGQCDVPLRAAWGLVLVP